MHLTQATGGELLKCLEISCDLQCPSPAEELCLDESNPSCVIGIAGKIDICSADELKRILVLALKLGKNLQIDLSAASEIDITALQLLWAAAIEAKRKGNEFALKTPLPQSILACVNLSGLNIRMIPT